MASTWSTTNYGLIGVVPRSLDEGQAAYLQITDEQGELEWVFNNISADENGGIYVVSHKRMHRVQWTGSKLTLDEAAGAWSAPYGTGNDNPLPVQSLAGSGSTPSLMGTRVDDDRFVVITDGEKVMNIVLFWRDEIPEDWEQLPGTDSRRIAAQVPVTFGKQDLERSFSDQSVLIRGYGAFVVNNELTMYDDDWDRADANPAAEVPYSCRAATCGTCRVEVLEGGDALSTADEFELEVLDIFGN